MDFPMQVYHQSYDDQLVPIAISYAEIKIENGKAIVQSTKPSTTGFEIKPGTMDGGMDFPGGKFMMHDVLMRLEVGTARSKIPPPPQTVAGLVVPETSGNFDPTGDTLPTGVMCGAIDPSMFAQIPIPLPNFFGIGLDFTMLCGDQVTSHGLKACANGQADLDAGKCSSILDLMKYGCSGKDLLGQPTWVVSAIGEADADTDHDGVNDAYTMLTRIATQRVGLSQNGFAAGEPRGIPIPPEE
jgi:hypothetical protein